MLRNMLMTSVTPLNSLNEINCWSNMPFCAKWPVTESTKLKEAPNLISIRKKKRQRTLYSTQQLQYLEAVYSRQRYINKMERDAIMRKLNLGDRQVKIWFQNRRMRSKKESKEKIVYHVSEESGNSDTTLESRSLNESDQTLDDTMNRFQEDILIENSNCQLPIYTPPFQEQGFSSNDYPNSWNFQQNAPTVLSGDVHYPTEYYPIYYENNYFQYSAPQNLETEVNCIQGGQTTATYYNLQ